MPGFPSGVLITLRQLVSFLRTLPLPTTHPSHPASPEILLTLKDTQKGYADMRGAWVQKCLEAQGRRLIDRADTIDGVVSGKDFGRWVEMLLGVADVRFSLSLSCAVLCLNPAQDEYKLLNQRAPLSPPNLLSSTYSTLLTPLLGVFNNTLSSLIALIKKALHKHTFLALSAYEALLDLQLQWEDILTRRGADSRGNELKEGLATLRAVCLRSFPEFLADLKLAGLGRGGEWASTGVADFAISASSLFWGNIMDVLTGWCADCEVHGTATPGAGRCQCGANHARRWELEDGGGSAGWEDA